MKVNLRELDFNQILILKELPQHSSLRSLCNALGLSLSNISRDMNDLSEKLSVQIVQTSSRGYVLTPDGNRLSKIAANIWSSGEQMFGAREGLRDEKDRPCLTIGGRGYLNLFSSHLLVSEFEKSQMPIRFRFLDLAPQDMVQLALLGVVDILLHFEELELPQTWLTETLIPEIDWKVHLGENHPLIESPQQKSVRVEDVLKFPFVVSSAWSGREVMTVEDGFPLGWTYRRKGFESQTALTALEICSNSTQVSFLPDIFQQVGLAHRIRTFALADHPKITKRLNVSVHSQRVTLKTYKSIVDSFRNLHSYSQEEKNEDRSRNNDDTRDKPGFPRASANDYTIA